MATEYEAGDPLIMWTVYNSPRDYPGEFVARMWKVTSKGTVPTREIIRSTDIDVIRRELMEAGLTCIVRSPGDEPQIVESWL